MALYSCSFRIFLLGFLIIFLIFIGVGIFQLLKEVDSYVYDLNFQPEYHKHREAVDLPFYQQIHEILSFNIDHPIILWWTPFTGEMGQLKNCGGHKCFFTQNRAFKNHPKTKVFMFYGTYFSQTDLPLPRQSYHEWALLHEESPKNNFLFSFEEVLHLFNHTSTFKQESDFPITMQHLISLDSLTSNKYTVSTEEKNQFLTTLAPLNFVHSDCDTPSGREEIVEELMKFIPIDSYGSCLHNKDLPLRLQDPISGMDDEEFWKIIAKYKFTLAIENAICDDYITEKLWRPLYIGSVPVYLGSPTIEIN